MIRAAFYAPMKSPDDPVPSGDRAFARALLAALEAGGVKTDIATDFNARDGKGLTEVQLAKIAAAKDEIARLIPCGRKNGWQVWITYHNYYKAPDLIGPQVSQALNIPYVQIEATRARKRLTGPWAHFAKAAEAATDAATLVFYLTLRDAEALVKYRPDEQVLAHLPPFIASQTLPAETTRSACILSVGMMREGDKTTSYRLIADTLACLSQEDWQIEIAGDGPTRPQVEAMMAPFGPRITFLGALDATALQEVYGRSRILFWPGVNEAFGMTYLEAQASGVTVLAQDRPGVRDVLFPGAAYPPPQAGAEGLAARLDLLLRNPKLTQQLGAVARDHVARENLLPAASERLRMALTEVLA